METVTHDGRETAYRVVDRGGDGPGVLAVHGSGGSHVVWRAQLARLSAGRPVAALDLSGHGDSTDVAAQPGPETLRAYGDDVLAVARATDAEILMGNSLGGAVCLHIALDRGVDPAGMVLAGSGAKLAVRPDLLEWLGTDFERAVEFLHGPDRLFHDPEPELRERSTALMREAGRAVVRRDFLTCDPFDVRERLGAIESPTLALTGRHDELTPPSYHEYLAEHVPDAEWTTIEDAAHLAMLERPEAFNTAVRSFLESAG